VRDLAGGNRREPLTTAEPRPAHRQQLGAPLRRAVVHPDSSWLEVGAQTVLAVWSLESVLVRARPVLSRRDRFLEADEGVGVEIVGTVFDSDVFVDGLTARKGRIG